MADGRPAGETQPTTGGGREKASAITLAEPGVWLIGTDIYRLDEGVEGSGMGLFLIGGPLTEDSAAKLKKSQLNVCTVYVYCVYSILPPVAEICARLAGNFCQYLTRGTSGAKSLV